MHLTDKLHHCRLISVSLYGAHSPHLSLFITCCQNGIFRGVRVVYTVRAKSWRLCRDGLDLSRQRHCPLQFREVCDRNFVLFFWQLFTKFHLVLVRIQWRSCCNRMFTIQSARRVRLPRIRPCCSKGDEKPKSCWDLAKYSWPSGSTLSSAELTQYQVFIEICKHGDGTWNSC